MSIEDVKQWPDDFLDAKLSEVLGRKPLLHIFGVPHYTGVADVAREVQAKAIELNTERYVKILADVVGVYQWDGCEGNLHPEGVAWLLTATPRQISEAAYLTLKG